MAGPLSGDIDIPKVGKFPKAAVVIGVGGVIALILYERSKSSTAAVTPSAATAPGAFPPDGTTGNPNDPYSTDPSTGQTYGNEAAAGTGTGYGGDGGGGYGLSAATDTYPWDGTYGNPSDPYSMDTSTGQTYGNEGSTVTDGTAGPPFSTNSEWSQYVLQYFTTNSFSDIAGMTTALGLYLAGQTVTSLQQGYVNDATAIAGKPPVSGAGGYPPSIRTAGSTASVTTPTGGSPAAVVSGGHVVSVNNNTAVVAWNATGATSFAVTIHGPGKINGRTNTVPVKQATYSGLEAGHTYDVSVQPLVNGKPSGRSGTITVKTTKGK